MDKKPWYERFKKQDVFDPSKFTYLGQEEARILNEMTPLEYRKPEKLYNQIVNYLFMAVSLVLLVFAFVYSFTTSRSFSGTSGYGILGLIFIAVALVAWILFSFFTMRYHNTYERDKEGSDNLHLATYFLLIALILTCYFLIPLRSQVLAQYQISHPSTGYVPVLSYVMIALSWVISIILGLLTILFKDKKRKVMKKIDFAFLALALYIPLFFLPVIQTTYSIGYSGSYLVIFAPIVLDISLVVSLFSNMKRLTHSVYHTIFNLSIMMEFIALVVYSINISSSIA